MIDLKDLRADPDKYRRGASAKNDDPARIDRLLEADAALREVQTRSESLVAEQKAIGKAVGQLAGRLKAAQKAGDGDQIATLQAEIKAAQARPAELKTQVQALADELAELEKRRDELWLGVPQPPDPDVPVGRSAEDNVPLRSWNPGHYNAARTFEANRGFKPRTHLELVRDLSLVDFERGVKIAGSRSYVLTGRGMQLHQAVLRYAFDTMTQRHGFTAMSVPVLVRDQCMVGTGFFPHGRDQAYEIANPTGDYGLALTGTGEVGLMGLHMDEILDAQALPLRYTTVSTCFRREAGAAGKDTAGLYRVHQFDKVEQVVICRADEGESRRWHQTMISYVEELLQSLGLPYRLLQCCTGDLGPKNADMIDIECWIPTRRGDQANADTGDFGETHSASRLYDYQCRRLNLRYKDPDTGRNLYCHALNNTVAASPRILIPILEIYQNKDGSVTVPEPLRPYMGGLERIEP